MARKRRDAREGSDSAYDYQNALASCCTTALGALALLVAVVILGAAW